MLALYNPSPCDICPNRSNPRLIVPAHGPESASILYVGEGPSWNEHRDGIPFAGKAGKEFNENYLPQYARTPRPSVKVANAVSCFFGGDNQTAAQACACAPLNLAPLVRTMPNLTHVVLMGGVACSLLNDWAIDAETGEKLQAPQLMVEHGLPINYGRPVNFFGRRVKILATIHPAAGLHQPSAMADIFEDFANIRRWREQGWLGPQDRIGRDVEYEQIHDGFDWECFRGHAGTIAIDTERDSRRNVWCAQVSAWEGSGFMIRNNYERLQELIDQAHRVLIHNAKHDLVDLARIGIHVPLSKLVDTMVMAYALGLPQSLKTLARRLAGMQMQSWEEIVGEQFEQDAIEWLLAAESAVGRRAEAWEAEVMASINDMAEAAVPAGVKRRNQLVNGERKRILAEIEEQGLDEWRPPVVRYINKNNLATRRRNPAYAKQLNLALAQHLRSKESGRDGVDFRKRWWGDGYRLEHEDEGEKVIADDAGEQEPDEPEQEASPGLAGRLPEWALKIAYAQCGEFPRMGLDRAPFEQALHYACRDVDALQRIWPVMEKMTR